MKHKITVLAGIISITLSGCGGGSSDDGTPVPVESKAALVKINEILADNEHCSTGGIKVDTGFDDNENNILDQNELLEPRYYCNDGTRFENGDEGLYEKSLVTVLSITKDDARCSSGGQLVLAGIDQNKNNTLEKGEINEQFFMCNTGHYTAEPLIINSVVSSSAIVSPESTAILTANISNLKATDTLYWFDKDGVELTPDDANNPNVITIQVGKESGVESYQLVIHRLQEFGDDLVQTKTIAVTVGSYSKEVKSVQLNHSQVLLPDGFKEKEIKGDFTGVALYGDVITDINQYADIPTPDNIDLMGFVSERSALQQGDNAHDILNAMVASLSASLSVNQISKIQLKNGDVSASYDIGLYTKQRISNVLNTILTTTSMNKIGGTIDTLVPSSTEIESDRFQLNMVISYNAAIDNLIVTATLIDTIHYETYKTLIKATTSESVHAPIGTQLKLHNEQHTAVEQVSTPADFLFVIDNSGSMGDEQDEISLMTDMFIQTVTAKGMDFKVGTITTDSDELRGVGFTNDVAQIKEDFKPGTSGDYHERGIYYSEKALEPAAGTVALDGYPRNGASLSVIIMSDEQSQYGLTPAFDPLNNVFITEQYRVYSIVQPNDARYSQYDDLSFATAGETLNINLIDKYQLFMEKIAEQAGSSTVGYALDISVNDGVVVAPSISVTVDGIDVDRKSTDGWEYNPLTNTIQFSGTAIPNIGANIVFSYNYFQ